MTSFEDLIDRIGAEYESGELAPILGRPHVPAASGSQPGSPTTVTPLAGVGTIAAGAVRSPALHAAATAMGVSWQVTGTYSDLDALVGDRAWRLALVLSPHKLSAASLADVLAPAADRTQVVDTLVRNGDRIVGLNTNVHGAGAALARILVPARPDRLVLLGTGASARSVLEATRRWLPKTIVSVHGRSAAAAADLAGAAEVATYRIGDPRPDVVVNTTSWGETEASELQPFGIDLDALIGPGVVVFDLNNRVSRLKTLALEAGAAVVPGVLMQRVVNALRVRIAGR